MDERGESAHAADQIELEKTLRLRSREFTWLQTEHEHTVEALQRVRRQRARLRDQVDTLSAALSESLSARYWAEQQPAPTGFRRRRTGSRPAPEAELVAAVEASPLFDGAWYLRTHPKAARADLAPALHYVRNGNRHGLDPGPGFSTSGYLDLHPEVADSGLPALVHAESHRATAETTDSPAAPSPAGDIHL